MYVKKKQDETAFTFQGLFFFAYNGLLNALKIPEPWYHFQARKF